MMSARTRSAAAALLFLVAVEGNVKDKFWGFLEDVSNEKSERSDVTTIAKLLEQGAGVHVESCGGKSDVMTVLHADFIRASLQVRAYGSVSRNVSGGTLRVKMYKGSAAKGSSTEDWLKREMAWHSVPHAYEEGLCKHFSKSHSRRACPLPAGDTVLRLALDKLPPMVVAGAYKLKIKATDEAGKPVTCLWAQVDVPRGKSGELFRRVEALPTAPSGRTLSAHGQCMCGPSDPVCGDDGKTYVGACEAGCANVGVAYLGSCAGPARLGERELDRRTSVEAPTAAPTEACEDDDDTLASWGLGYTECSAVPVDWCGDDDVRNTCCESCSATETCVDDDAGVMAFGVSIGLTVADCTDAIAQGYCEYIGDYCCECSGETTTTAQACEDTDYYCSDYVSYGWCTDDSYESWLEEDCALSCGYCTAATTEMPESCPATCSGRTCDDWAEYYTCNYVETYWNCDCSGCDCAVSTPAPTPAECVCTEEYDPVCLYGYLYYQNTCYAKCDGYDLDYLDSADWSYGTCDASGVAPRGLALLFSLSLAALPQ